MISKKYVEFLIKNKLSANQYLILWCLMSEELELLKNLEILDIKESDFKYLICSATSKYSF